MITSVMGILNVTPDSFSDGGKYNTRDAALFRAQEMLKEGADIIDVGGESTRPGAPVVSAEEEIERVVPIVEAIKKRLDVKISLDTYKAKTARAGIEAGVDIINDIGGLLLDEEMGNVVSEAGVIYILTHNIMNGVFEASLHKSKEKGDNNDENVDIFNKVDIKYTDYVNQGVAVDITQKVDETQIEQVDITQNIAAEQSYITQYTNEAYTLIENALSYGIKRENIIFDVGIGFNKTQEQNICILKRLDELCKLKTNHTFALQMYENEADNSKSMEDFYPVMLGVSRKSVIGHILDLPVGERLEGTLTLTALAVLRGVKYIRVHDVKENVRVARMLEAVI